MLVSSLYVFLRAILVFYGKTRQNTRRHQKWQEREGRVVNLQTVVFSILSPSCDSRANIMVSLCRTLWEFCSDKALTHNAENSDYLVTESIGPESSSHQPHVQTSHRKSLTLPQKVLYGYSCWTTNCSPLFHLSISQHSLCCVWHTGLWTRQRKWKPVRNKELHTGFLC